MNREGLEDSYYSPELDKPCPEKMLLGCEECPFKRKCSQYEPTCLICKLRPCICKHENL